jgi:hypothetical protein
MLSESLFLCHTHTYSLCLCARSGGQGYQYVLFAAEPYETIAFKLQSREVDRGDGRIFAHWDPYVRARPHTHVHTHLGSLHVH